MGKATTLCLIAVLLACCSKPPPMQVCTDYRIMAYYAEHIGILGPNEWVGPIVGNVCVISETSTPSPAE